MTRTASKPWWLEWEIGLLLALVGLAYSYHMNKLPFRGEETRRAQIAREMVLRGDWIVPRQQGEPFLSRPPLQNWIIAGMARLRGDFDETSTRLPSVIAMLACVGVIYGYGRTFLSRLGALGAAAAFATMGQVMQLGRVGESEALYTLLVAGSLVAWRWSDAAGRPPLWTWCLGYALAALGMLTKGPQAPAYFVAGVGTFLVLKGRWRELLAWPHAAGMALFLAVWGAWQVPFWLRTSASQSWEMLTGDVALRFAGAGPRVVLTHLVTYPIEVIICTLPWSVLLMAYLRRDFRRDLGTAADDVRFLACAVAATFPTCWLVAGARGRYFMPLYPCLALLIGVVIQKCCQEEKGDSPHLPERPGGGHHVRMVVAQMGTVPFFRPTPWARLWTGYVRVIGLVILLAAAWVLAAAALGWGWELGPWFAAGFAGAAAVLAVLAFRSSGVGGSPRPRVAVVAVAAFLALTYAGVGVNLLIARARPLAQRMAEVKRRLPAGVQLVSVGAVDPTFAFYYGEPIRQIPFGRAALGQEGDWSYFCVDSGPSRPKCDFPYEELAVACCDPVESPHPKGVVLIGRRLRPERDSRAVPTAVRIDAAATTRR